MNKIDLVETPRLRKDVPGFRPGDTVRVHVRVVEGGRERVQVFQGVVIRRKGGGLRETFTARKVSFGVGVERTFPIHSPSVTKIEVVSRGHVRRSKLYYLRELRGKRARIRELRGEAAEALAAADAEILAAAEAEAQAKEAAEETAPEDLPEEGAADAGEPEAEAELETETASTEEAESQEEAPEAQVAEAGEQAEKA